MRINSSVGNQKGASSFSVILVLVILALVTNASVRYFAVAYNCENLKNEMRASVFLGQASGANSSVALEQARQRVQRAITENEIPYNAYVDVDSDEGQLYARVAFTVRIPLLPFGLYDYMYVFDETATPSGFLPKASPSR